MKKNTKTFFSIVLFVFLFICFTTVKGEEILDKIWVEGTGSVINSETCSKWNGCSMQSGYKFTLISGYKKEKNGIKYSKTNKNSVYRSTSDTWKVMKLKLENNEKGIVESILEKIGIDVNEFLNSDKNYWLMVEPVFDNFYVPTSKKCEGSSGCYNYKEMKTKIATAKDSAYWLSKNDYELYNKYGGFRDINRNFMCQVYVSGVGENDKLCDMPAQRNYRKDYLKYAADGKSPYGVAFLKATNINIRKNYYIKIYKYDKETGKLIQPEAEFTLYKGHGCNSSNAIEIKKTSGGVLSFENLNDNQEYSIKETKLPNGYDFSDGYDYCLDTKIQGASWGFNWVNESSCTTELSKIEKTPEKLIELYNQFLSKGENYNMLLNFNKPKCETKACNTDNEISCLNANLNTDGFNQNNLSCYTSTMDVNGKTAYCQESFIFSNDLNIKEYLGFVSAGQMILKYEQGKIAGTGTLTRKCYLYGENLSYNILANIDTYKEYISDVKLNNESMEYNVDTNKSSVSFNDNGYIMNIVANYRFKDIVADIGTGLISSSGSVTNTRIIGSGVATRLTYTTLERQNKLSIPFEIKFSDNFLSNEFVKDLNGSCEYNVEQLIITEEENEPPKLNLEFRVIDTNNPFPGKNGQGRLVGDNWCYSSEKMDVYRLIFLCPVEKLSKSECESIKKLDLEKYDKNGDGEITFNGDLIRLGAEIKNEEQVDIKELNQSNNFKICDNNNKLIQEKIKDANNSYNINKKEAKYTIILDSQTIRKIRGYNSVRPYDDTDNLECENGENCKSNAFLRNANIISSNNIMITD